MNFAENIRVSGGGQLCQHLHDNRLGILRQGLQAGVDSILMVLDQNKKNSKIYFGIKISILILFMSLTCLEYSGVTHYHAMSIEDHRVSVTE